jgi:hypothetical protein
MRSRRYREHGNENRDSERPKRGLPAGVPRRRLGLVARARLGHLVHAEVSRESLNRRLDGYREDPDAVRIEIDSERIRAQSEDRIAAWNEPGRGICARFLDAAGSRLPR